MNTSIDPPGPPKKSNVDPEHWHKKLLNLKDEARILLQTAAHYDGPGDPYKNDYKWAWSFVKKVAKIKGV